MHTPPADTWQDWVEKFGIDPDRVRSMESDDLALVARRRRRGTLSRSRSVAVGITAYAGREDNDLILWLPSIGAIVTGDSLSDLGDGLDIWIADRKHVTRDEWSNASVRCSTCRSNSYCPRTASRQISQHLSAFFPERRRRDPEAQETWRLPAPGCGNVS